MGLGGTKYPKLINDNPSVGGATHEIHIFLLPVDPPEVCVQLYQDWVKEWNKSQLPGELAQLKSTAMKACHLSLEYLNEDSGAEGPSLLPWTPSYKNLRVMQSSRYVYENDTAKVIAAAKRDAKWFEQHNFSVARVKIEASAHGNQGIPQLDQEALQWPKCYFEFHLKVAGAQATTQDLRSLAQDLSRKHQVPVPFSHNLNPHQMEGDRQGHQLYLNMRFRKTGLINAQKAIDELKEAIGTYPQVSLVKVISEYVWYDTAPELDRGWIE